MKKKSIWHKIRSLVRKIILTFITTFAFLLLIASVGALMEQTMRAFIWFIVSVAWIVLFGHANGWMQECP
jgi:hypothetical protein